MTNNSPLLLHIPHASIVIPPEELEETLLEEEEVNKLK